MPKIMINNFREVIKMNDRISIKPEIMCGKPCIRGTRIPVYIVLNLMAAGYSIEKVLETYPKLTREDVLAAILYAGSLTEREEHYSLQQAVL